MFGSYLLLRPYEPQFNHSNAAEERMKSRDDT